MFEQEIEMEKRSSGIGPLLLVLTLAFVVIGGIGYYVYQMKKGLTQQEAIAVINPLLASKTASVHFQVGTVMPSVDEKPKDPHYALLQKAGIVTLQNAVGGGEVVRVTDAGDKLLNSFPEFKKFKNTDGTQTYIVPLADRKLVGVRSITMLGPSSAKVEFTWKWDANRLGESFDASGSLLKTFNTWDRSKLISNYGADFFKGDPKTESILLVRGNNGGWQVATPD